MRKIKRNIYFESNYAGVSIGAFLFSGHTVLVDAPLKPEDGRAWLTALKDAGASPHMTLVQLDAHPDRTLGAQTLQADVLAHEEIARQFRRRAAVFKTVRQESGAEWESTPGLTGLRWVLPRITFSHTAQLHFDDTQLHIQPRPGPGPDACWLLAPNEGVLFIGDVLTIDQPPFIGQADIPQWMEQLEELQSRQYKDYTIIAGRGGKAEARDAKQMHSLLKDMHGKLRGISRSKNASAEIEKLAAKYADRYKPSLKLRPLYGQRLRYGMQEYATRMLASAKRK